MKYVVIIPAHNEANYLSGLLESLFAQSTLPAEVVLVNDQSTDETEKIMQAAVESLPKHPIHQSTIIRRTPSRGESGSCFYGRIQGAVRFL